MDVSCELSRIAKQVYLSTRNGCWVTPKLTDYGYPFDMWLKTRYHYYIQQYTPEWFFPYLFERKLQKVFDHDKYGMRPNRHYNSKRLTLSDELHGKIASGTVVVKPNIKKFKENGIIFENGSYVDCDEVS